jgi:hypothetical protein
MSLSNLKPYALEHRLKSPAEGTVLITDVRFNTQNSPLSPSWSSTSPNLLRY